MFRKILVANRGEIAVRIIMACRELGVPTIAVYSEADRDGPWTRLADESYPLGGVTARESYLNQEALFAVAEVAGADGVHPGYGFLSENAAFAAACAERGLQFIGPSADAIRAMGSKARARDIAVAADVPVIPGLDGAEHDDRRLRALAGEMGYPVLIKASAGGGGKGMRIVWSEAEFDDALQQARQEAASAFGDAHVLVEKYFTEVRHIEVQVLGDHHGNLVHLFERECSIQRRHQKIIEESPSPVMTPELREAMCTAALRLAEAVGYVNAGTVEFVVTPELDFYFLEMNTRLQVEHPITEAVTGVDIALWQIRVAAGEPLAFDQQDLRQRGNALECRLYAEDAAQNFLPSTGDIALYRAPDGPGVRVDDGVETGTEVTPYYDPMLGKVITWGADRAEAIRKMVRALEETVVLGVTTNIPFLLDILQQPQFLAGDVSTTFLQEEMMPWKHEPEVDDETWLAIAALEALQGRGGAVRPAAGKGDGEREVVDPWRSVDGWRNVQMEGQA